VPKWVNLLLPLCTTPYLYNIFICICIMGTYRKNSILYQMTVTRDAAVEFIFIVTQIFRPSFGRLNICTCLLQNTVSFQYIKIEYVIKKKSNLQKDINAYYYSCFFIYTFSKAFAITLRIYSIQIYIHIY